MFARLVRVSLARRKARTAMAILAVMMGAAVASAMFTTSFSLNDRLAREFRAFGANIIVLPPSDTVDSGLPGVSFDTVTDQGFIDESQLYRIKQIPNWSTNILGYAPMLYQVVSINSTATGQGARAVLAGTYFNHVEPKVAAGWTTGLRHIASWWHIRGGWVQGDTDVNGSMVGIEVARELGLEPGMNIRVEYSDAARRISSSREFTVKGIVTTGGNEDDQVFVNLNVAQEMSDRPGRVHAVFVNALCNACPAEEMAKDIQMTMPVRAKSVRQIVRSESVMVSGLDRLMLATTVAALAGSALVVMTAMTTAVMERRREIGIMKAVGASDGKVAALFLTEALVIGVLGGLGGFAAGIAMAELISRTVFGVAVVFSARVLPITVGMAVAVAVASSVLPIRRALQVQPASVLRGD
jgi:putative ABC transport system permease protein